ncbi:MAG TPA: alpha/beta hydrolase-fold protein [Pirellulales bacterium]|nr:alpha/beta hydrolase-fold protein [Pirellulales bacterium]
MPSDQPKEITIAGHRAHVFEPTRRNPHGWAIVFLHDIDGGGLHGRQAYLEQFQGHGLPCIAPISGRSWWTQRIWPAFDDSLSAEQFVMEPILDYAVEQWESRPPQVALVGIGMGGQGALRLSFKFPNRLPIAAAVAPALDYQLAYYDEEETALAAMYAEPEAARQDTAILHVHPLNWPRNIWFAADPTDERWYGSAERLKMKLAALGIPHEADLETASLAANAYADLMAATAVNFVVQRLDRERLRVTA